MNNRELGAKYEQEACEYIASLGMHVLARNWRTRNGEIDIVARDEDTIVFIEVKFRKSNKKGDALEQINYKKQQQIRHMAVEYLHYIGKGENTKIRFDCVGITGDNFKYVKGAF